MRTRLLVATVAVAALSLPVPARAQSRAPGESWQLTFTPSAVRAVGEPVPRGQEECGYTSCQAQWQFPTRGAGDGQQAQLFVGVDTSACPAAPCDIAVPPRGGGFSGTVHWDGTTYTGRGSFTQRRSECDGRFDGPEDTFRVTPVSEREVTGDASVALSFVADTTNGGCRVTGYEVYTGPVTGRRGVSGGATPPPGTGALPPPGARSAVRADLSAAGRAAAVADRAAARTHARPVLSTGVADARELPWSPAHLLVSALLALLLVALLPFPAALFNATLEANYATVRRWCRILPVRDRDGDTEDLNVPVARRPRAALVVVVVAAALLNAFLDPRLGFDRASFVLVGGLALSIATVALLASVPARAHARRAYGERVVFRAFPLGLAVAAVCVLVSRLASFEPGYLYGVVAAYAFRREPALAEKGRVEFRAAAFLLGVAVLAFAVRVPVHAAAVDSSAVPLALLDTVLAALFAAGVEGNLLGLLPLRFLPGEAVLAWSRPAWAAAFGASAFAFLHALSARAGDASTGVSVAVAATLFAAFATASLAFWAWFRFHPAEPTPASV
jgi:hypothetical protein